jgi:hypothetical protein
MNRPELRVIDGEDSADKRFMGFVKEHTRPDPRVGDETISLRSAVYRYINDTPIDSFNIVAFEIEEIADYPGEHIYSIGLLLGLEGPIVFEIQYDDNPEIGFRDMYTEQISDETAVDDLIDKLSLAEANGKLIKI